MGASQPSPKLTRPHRYSPKLVNPAPSPLIYGQPGPIIFLLINTYKLKYLNTDK